jgi:hypothetical protein
MNSRIEVIEKFKDKWWRLNNLYFILDEHGKKVKFECNPLQSKLYWDLWYCNLILKARQFGGTTFVDLYYLDDCLFISNIEAAIIAHKQDDAKKIFRRKVHFPYHNLPDGLRGKVALTKEAADGLEFSNGSGIYVSTSVRSGTVQRLHISEHGKICRKYPDKAEEIRTGSLNAIHPGNIVCIESTAEGRYGDFYYFCNDALKQQQEKRELTRLDFKLHFFPWFWDSKNRLSRRDARLTYISPEKTAYFDGLESKGLVTTPDGKPSALTLEQRAWYVAKEKKMKDKMLQEYPATPEEAFQATIKGAYYALEMTKMRKDGRILRIPYEPRLPVNTAWDLGLDERLRIVFHQGHGMENRLINHLCLPHNNLPLAAKALQDMGYVYGVHYLPHDIEVESLSTGKTRLSTLQELLPGHRIVVVPKLDLADGISATSNFLGTCWIDNELGNPIIDALDNYQREPDDKHGGFKSTPLKNDAIHTADAVRYLAVGHTQTPKKPSQGKRRRRSAKVV